MEENMNKATDSTTNGNSSGKCGKFGCMCGYGHRRYALRWLFGIIILAVVFAIGMKVGELKSGFGRGHFGHSRGGYMMQHYPNPIMRAYPMGSGSGTTGATPGAMMLKTATSTPAK